MIALDELKKLPIEERWQIVEELTKSIEEDRDFDESPELIMELKRRMEAYHANPGSGIPWETLRAKLLERSA